MEFEIKKYLECTVCKDLLVPITSCNCKKRNHVLIDGKCEEITKKCPVCKSVPDSLVVTSIVKRNLNWEDTELPCRNLSQGCARQVKPGDMEGHLSNCDFRVIRCMEWGIRKRRQCLREYSPQSLFHHWLNEHKIVKIALDPIPPRLRAAGPDRSKLAATFKIFAIRFNVSSKGNRVVNWPVSYFDIGGHIFFLHIHHNDKFEVLHIWITFLGEEAEAKGYKYGGELWNDQSNAKPLMFEDIPVHSVQYKDIAAIQGLGHTFTMAVSYSDLKKFKDLKIPKKRRFSYAQGIYVEYDWPEWNLKIDVFKLGVSATKA